MFLFAYSKGLAPYSIHHLSIRRRLANILPEATVEGIFSEAVALPNFTGGLPAILLNAINGIIGKKIITNFKIQHIHLSLNGI